MDWTSQQAKALDAIGTFLADPREKLFRLFGYAGTGKTTLARHIGQDINVLFLAYTGKAASVLRKKGIANARTIHSALYGVGDSDPSHLIELMESLQAPRSDEHRKSLEAQIAAERARLKRPRFWVNRDSEAMKDADLIFIDECSMVDPKIRADLESFNKKIIAAGDPFQLPPVYGVGTYMRERADVMLTEIRRQELDNPIIRASMQLRDREILPYGVSPCGRFRKLKKSQIADEFYGKAGQLLTGMNVTRRALNMKVRGLRGVDVSRTPYPVKDEPIILLRNDNKLGVLNGVIATMRADAQYGVDGEGDDALIADVLYEGQEMRLPLCPSQFKAYWPDTYDEAERESDPQDRAVVAADFGYAITVHKSQGSQWPSICLVDDGFNKRKPDERFRWQYTAITRAEERVTIVG